MTPVKAWDLEPGTYICFRTPGPFGWLIRAVTRSRWNHAALVVPGGKVVQATLRGVKVTPLSAFIGYPAVANAAEPMTAQEREDAVAFGLAVAMQQEEYAFALLPVIALRLAGLRWAWLLRAGQRGDGDPAVICSELVAEEGARAGKDWQCGEPSPACVRPDELAGREPFMVPVSWEP